MKRLSIVQKNEALMNALVSFKFPDKYFIQNADRRLGHRFAIASKNEHGGVCTHSTFMTYEEMNCFLMGYNRAKANPFI